MLHSHIHFHVYFILPNCRTVKYLLFTSEVCPERQIVKLFLVLNKEVYSTTITENSEWVEYCSILMCLPPRTSGWHLQFSFPLSFLYNNPVRYIRLRENYRFRITNMFVTRWQFLSSFSALGRLLLLDSSSLIMTFLKWNFKLSFPSIYSIIFFIIFSPFHTCIFLNEKSQTLNFSYLSPRAKILHGFINHTLH